MAARITSLVVGVVGILIGLMAEKANVAHLVALAFAVASSGNLPVVVLSLFWRKFNTAGVISGLVVGTVASIGLVYGFAQHDLSESSRCRCPEDYHRHGEEAVFPASGSPA